MQPLSLQGIEAIDTLPPRSKTGGMLTLKFPALLWQPLLKSLKKTCPTRISVLQFHACLTVFPYLHRYVAEQLVALFSIGAETMQIRWSRWYFLLLFSVCQFLVGCTVYPPRISGYPTGVAPGQYQALQQQHTNLAARFQELNNRAGTLDADNQRLQALLAQQQQQSAQLQTALQGSRDTVADLRDDLTAERRAQGSYAGHGSVAAEEVGYNSGGGLPLAQISGAEVNQDGAAVRIRLDGAQLFSSGKASIVNNSGNSKLLDDVVVAIRSHYPGRQITIEGHTDSDPIRRSRWKNNKELSAARAQAVFQALRRRGVPERQLAVEGLGASQPLADNSTKAGKARNRRVEIVIHP